ncbi:hypothetical protein PSH03_005394 [Micromonospora sp. PSH03]|uniref:hypothetical protein n=1 Tax=Micromonospora salmantinae TaxID=2911211 RepID=UPI001EE789FE|nr:hypothetical protein [Micromonospora salmantinae]MCG5459611.1 hypothetical protein [Micromonospora salmantinae]
MRINLSRIPRTFAGQVEAAVLSGVVNFGMTPEEAVTTAAEGVRAMAISQGWAPVFAALLGEAAQGVGEAFYVKAAESLKK